MEGFDGTLAFVNVDPFHTATAMGVFRAIVGPANYWDSAEIEYAVGFAVVQRTSLALHLTKLVVLPAQRRSGVGTALLAAAIETARHGRAQLVTLHVDEGNAPAQALYRRMGFGVTGRRDDYYRVGRHALVMELELA